MNTDSFNPYLISKYFYIKSPLRDTKNVLEAPPVYLQKINSENRSIYEKLKKKHNTDNPKEAFELEMKELEKSWEPSSEAIEYIKTLNGIYKGKKIKFYYSDPMLYHFSIDDPDCDHIPVYEEKCESIELIATKTRKLPMIVTKTKNYSIINIVNIKVVDDE